MFTDERLSYMPCAKKKQFDRSTLYTLWYMVHYTLIQQTLPPSLNIYHGYISYMILSYPVNNYGHLPVSIFTRQSLEYRIDDVEGMYNWHKKFTSTHVFYISCISL